MHQLFVSSLVLVLCLLGWSTNSVGEQPPAPQGELRIVDTDPLNWAWITWNVFEHLVEIDKDGKLVPRLATTWRWLDDRTLLNLAETSVTEQHWSVRQGAMKQ